VGFVVDRVALGQVFLRFPRFSPVSIISSLLSILSCIISGMDNGPVSGPVPETKSHPIAIIIITTKINMKFAY
jgi:hypothetical protein